MLQIKNISKQYKTGDLIQNALKDVSLNFRDNEFVSILGPSGSGKTTLAKVIANHTKSNFITLNAVLTGVAEIRTSIKQAEDYFNLYSRRTILFL